MKMRHEVSRDSFQILVISPLVLRQMAILKPKVGLFALAPRSLPVKVHVYPLLILVGYGLGLRMPLEPCEILYVEAP